MQKSKKVLAYVLCEQCKYNELSYLPQPFEQKHLAAASADFHVQNPRSSWKDLGRR